MKVFICDVPTFRGDERPWWDAAKSRKGPTAKGDKPLNKPWSQEGPLACPESCCVGLWRRCSTFLEHWEGLQREPVECEWTMMGRTFWNQAGEAAGNSQQLGDVQQ